MCSSRSVKHILEAAGWCVIVTPSDNGFFYFDINRLIRGKPYFFSLEGCLNDETYILNDFQNLIYNFHAFSCSLEWNGGSNIERGDDLLYDSIALQILKQHLLYAFELLKCSLVFNWNAPMFSFN